MVMMRSPAGRSAARALRSVVLPEPVPPLTTMLERAPPPSRSSAATAGAANASSAIRATPKRRIVRHGPSTATGRTITFTRDPSAKRASTIGLDRSTRSPSGATIRSMRWGTVASSSTSSVAFEPPWRSTHTAPPPLTITSVTVGSARNGSRGPSPLSRAKARPITSSRSASASSGANERALATRWLRCSIAVRRQPASCVISDHVGCAAVGE